MLSSEETSTSLPFLVPKAGGPWAWAAGQDSLLMASCDWVLSPCPVASLQRNNNISLLVRKLPCGGLAYQGNLGFAVSGGLMVV